MAHYVFMIMIAHYLIKDAVKKKAIILSIILNTITFVIIQAAQVVYKQQVILLTAQL